LRLRLRQEIVYSSEYIGEKIMGERQGVIGDRKIFINLVVICEILWLRRIGG